MYICICKCMCMYVEQRIWALKFDEHTLSTVQHLSLLELEGRLKALNGCSSNKAK